MYLPLYLAPLNPPKWGDLVTGYDLVSRSDMILNLGMLFYYIHL